MLARPFPKSTQGLSLVDARGLEITFARRGLRQPVLLVLQAQRLTRTGKTLCYRGIAELSYKRKATPQQSVKNKARARRDAATDAVDA